jgi:hypothetical protein
VTLQHLEKQGYGNDKKQLLHVEKLLPKISKMKPGNHFTDNDHCGNGNGQPLHPEYQGLKQWGAFIRAVFDFKLFHDISQNRFYDK